MGELSYGYTHAPRSQVTLQRLSEARAIVAACCELNLGDAPDAPDLARCLEGVADAMADIIAAKGVVDVTSARIDSRADIISIPQVGRTPVLRSGVRGRYVFAAQLREGMDVTLGMYEAAPARAPLYEVDVPSGLLTRKLLSQQEHDWRELVSARDFHAQPDFAYPFHYVFRREGDTGKYAQMFQDTARQLLEASLA